MPETANATPRASCYILFPQPDAGGWRWRDTNARYVGPRHANYSAACTWAEAQGASVARGWIMPRHNRARHRLTGAEARGILVEMESQGLTPAKRRACAGAFARMIARGASYATYDAECVYRDYATGAPAHVESAQ